MGSREMDIAMRNIKHRIMALGLLVVVAALAASGCGSAASKPQPTAPAPATLTPSGITAEGKLEPVRFAELSAATNGSISEVLGQEGDTVQAGQVIARIQSADALTLEQAQAQAAKQLSAAHDNVRAAQNKLDQFIVPGKFS